MVRSGGSAGLGGPRDFAGSTATTTTPTAASSDCQRRRRRRRKRRKGRGRSAGSATAPDSASLASDALPTGAAQVPPDTTVGASEQRFPEHDPLAEALCAAHGPPAAVIHFDPMLEELLAATFVATCPAQAALPGPAEPPPVTAAPLPQPAVDQPDFNAVAPTGSVELTPVAAEAQELSQTTPPRANPPDVMVGDETHSSLAGVGSAHLPTPLTSEPSSSTPFSCRYRRASYTHHR
jgi:hypothetical protein